MRFLLTIVKTTDPQGFIPLNYQYELSAWIYKTINLANADFAEWLHSKGYSGKKRQFKLFTFSQLNIPEYRIEKNRLRIISEEISLILSFFPAEITENFVAGIFQNQKLILGNKNIKTEFVVQRAEKLANPSFSDDMHFRLLSPLHLTLKNHDNTRRIDHLHPDHPEYSRVFFNNLADKNHALGKPARYEPEACKLEVTGRLRSKLITIKSQTSGQTKLKGYLFDFRAKAPAELLRTGYYAGFGKSNALGFGCAETITSKK